MPTKDPEHSLATIAPTRVTPPAPDAASDPKPAPPPPADAEG